MFLRGVAFDPVAGVWLNCWTGLCVLILASTLCMCAVIWLILSISSFICRSSLGLLHSTVGGRIACANVGSRVSCCMIAGSTCCMMSWFVFLTPQSLCA